MATSIIPVVRSRSIELWHDDAAERRAAPREDRMVAVCVDLPRRSRIPVRGAEEAVDWPMPVVAHARLDARS
jgi:hypothetical protein